MNQELKVLNGEWKLTLIPNRDVMEKQITPSDTRQLDSLGYPSVLATVPGNFELDLYRAGVMPDPYFSTNPWKYQTYENRHLWYQKTFQSDIIPDENTYLYFEGLDTVCEIFFNGEKIGDTDDMFLTYEFPLKDRLKQGENEILVHILPACIVSRHFELAPINRAQRYNSVSLSLRKAPYMFGWDIMPRFVSGGIWKSVSIIQKPKEELEQTYLYTTSLSPTSGSARLGFFVHVNTPEDDLTDLTVVLDAVCGDSVLHEEKRLFHTYELYFLRLEHPKLWFPKNSGEQNLYQVTVTLKRKDAVCDQKTFRFGVRTAELERTSVIDKEGNGKFCFKINGKKVFCLGTNWVPTDAFPSRWHDHLSKDLALLDDLGCNMVRSWGGGGYEEDAFYDYCDEHGILVWQDFSMACAVYPQTDDFAKRLETEAIAVVKRIRQHPSLLLYAGDNECDDLFRNRHGFRANPNDNVLTRKILKNVVENHTVVGIYLPSSPYHDETAFESGLPISEEHLWGPRDYFKGNYYKNSSCSFASETGYHGCPSPESLKKFIAKEHLFPIFDENGTPNDDWLCHSAEMQPDPNGPYAYRIQLMTNQVKTLFGFIPDNLTDYAKASQISQAEAFKYFIERFRIAKWKKTGIIWWNAVDGWPQISDAVVDWYGCKKLAYSYIKRSQKPLCLMFDEPCNGVSKLFAVNDNASNCRFRFELRDLTHDIFLANGEGSVDADESTAIWEGNLPVESFVLVTWKTVNGEKGRNHFSTSTQNISYPQYLKDLKKAELDDWNGFDD